MMSSLEIVGNEKVLEERFSIPGVELFGIVNKHGKMVDCWGKKDLDMSKNKKDMFLMQIALCNSMQCDFNEEFGTVNFCVIQREKTKFISFPLTEGNIALAVIDKKANYKAVVNRIKQTYANICNQNPSKGGF